MTYYRLAVQDRQSTHWIWKTTPLTSLQAVFQVLRIYAALPQDGIRVFNASSEEVLNEMLSRQNNHLESDSVTATQFLKGRNLAVRERAQSSSAQLISAQTNNSGESVASWAKDVWNKHTAMRTARVAQQASDVFTFSSLPEPITTSGVPSSLGMSVLDTKRLQFERGLGGDHDTPYRFTLPISVKEQLVWASLQTRMQAGELLS